jgi:hypothetical protein
MITDCINRVRERGTGGDYMVRSLMISVPLQIFFWLIKTRRMSWAEHAVRMVESRGAYRDLVGELEGKRPLGRLRHKMILKWIFKYCDGVGVGCIYLARDRDR